MIPPLITEVAANSLTTRTLVVLAVIVLVLSGCGGSGTPSPTASQGGPVSPDGLWTRLDEPGAEKATASFRSSATLSVYRLDRERLRSVLKLGGQDLPGGGNQKIALTLPDPAGSYEQFELEESPIMSPALAARFPQIKSYRGRSTADQTVTARINHTPDGFNAMVLSGNGAYFVDATDAPGGDAYVPYSREGLVQSVDYGCRTTPAPAPGNPNDDDEAKIASFSDEPKAKLRRFRVAVGATGEYVAAVHKPSNLQNPNADLIEDALAAIQTTVGRVSDLFEREIGIQLELIDDETEVIFPDAATDPYVDDISAENQGVLDQKIGKENYDIGHLFAAGGGGVARQGCVCNDEYKGEASSGTANPTGASFDFNYVAHEMGHQFGASHSFNGTTGYCEPPYGRVPERAYEPGSGSTLMSYSGTSYTGKPFCGDENIQDHCDDYFHAISLFEMNHFLTVANPESACPKKGDSCAQIIPTSNRKPSVDAGPDRWIPKETPFTLNAVRGSDPDGDKLMYVWEQFDNAEEPDPPNPQDPFDFKKIRPLFRSQTPDGNLGRTFPRLNSVLTAPTTYTAETLPPSKRSMTFRLTARDQRGSNAFDNMRVNVVETAGPFKVTQPQAGSAWKRGTKQTVTWDVAGTNNAPVSCAWVRILLFTGDDGPAIELLAKTKNNGSATVTVPVDAPLTERARVRVEAVGNVFFNFSLGDFRVLP